MTKDGSITEKTAISLGVVATALTLMCGMVVWFIRLEGRVDAETRISEIQGKRIDSIEVDRSKMIEVINRIDKRLSRIEWRLNIKEEKAVGE